jgi:glutamate/tyrosine decarboxylase-like PLP-dependent enzyme
MNDDFSSWFAGPKAENAEWFEGVLERIVGDYYAWRRNYFPEDGIVVGSDLRRQGEPFRDRFEDRLMELLGRLKADFPFQSPRYAAHMVAEQTLPSIAGYFAAMLYNPNNVSREAAPVTVRLELEACRMIGEMIGYDESGWGHLTGGGTVANFEALWVARTVSVLTEIVTDMRRMLALPERPIGPYPLDRLRAFADLFAEASAAAIPLGDVLRAYRSTPYCVAEQGLAALPDGRPSFVLAPESHHYCFDKCMDLLGFGRRSLVPVAVDRDFRMDVGDLAAKLDEIAAKNGRVVAVVAVVGTTEEGAVDPLDEIIELRERRVAQGEPGFWLHVDGAYGGYLRTMTQPARIGLGEPSVRTRVGGAETTLPLVLPEHGACQALERMGEADSVVIDPHKLGYVPYPAGAICFRSDLVKPLLRQEAPYLEEQTGDPEAERRSQGIGMYILEGSKPGAAAAAVWLSHTLIPLDTSGHGQLIRQTIRNACEFHALLTHRPVQARCSTVAVPLCPPGSNIVCYAFRPAAEGTPLSAINGLNRRLYDRFTIGEASQRRVYDQKFFVSRTVLSPEQYGLHAVSDFLERLGVTGEEYRREGVFLLRTVLMNPWYEQAKSRGAYFLSDLVEELYASAEECLSCSS